MSRAPTVLDEFDIEETDDIPFRFGPYMRPGESISSVAVDCRSVGEDVVDPSPAAVVAVPYEIQGTDVVQRVSSSLLGARYVVRVRSVLNSGRVLVGAAFFGVVKL